MDVERVRLLIRVANEINDEADKKSLLRFADELLADKNVALKERDTNQETGFVDIFRKLKGKTYNGRLLKGGRVEFDGKTYRTPSGAARVISNHNENGWIAWRYIDRTSDSEQPIEKIRPEIMN